MMLALTLFLAVLLAVSALHKVFERARLTAVVARLAGVALPLGSLLLVLAATIEVLAALMLLLPALRTGGALAALALWGGYGAVMLRNHGAVLDCGCDFVARVRPVDRFAVLRPAMLAVIAGFVAAFPPAGWNLEAPFAALALLALWFAAGELHSIPVTRKVHP